MLDILSAFLGPRVCAWCTRRDIKAYHYFYNNLPNWVHNFVRKSGYDSWVGRVGGGWHHAHHVPDEPDYDPCEGHS